MSDSFYFEHESASNSQLKNLRKLYNGKTLEISEALGKTFNMGSIVDSYLTDKGAIVPGVTKEQEELAVEIVHFMQSDPLIKILLEYMVGQVRFFKLLRFTYDGTEYTIRARVKFDGYCQRFKIAVEYKTTACTTQKAFEESIDFLDYDQGAAFYMDVASQSERTRIDRIFIIGICKSSRQLFKFAIERGDAVYERGRAKYSFWCFHWINLIEGFIHGPN